MSVHLSVLFTLRDFAAWAAPRSAAVSMQGIKLSTGETVGSWSLDVIDGKRDDSLEPSAAHDPGAVSSTTAEASADADTFGNRMMENLYYMKMKAKLKADEANKADKGKKKEGKKKALPASAAPVVIPEAMVSDKGGEVTLALTLALALTLTLTLTLTRCRRVSRRPTACARCWA